MITPHKKAYTYFARYVINNELHESTKIIALTDKAPDISNIIQKLNSLSTAEFILGAEIDLKKAIYKRGIAGGCIATDWKILDNMPYHSVEIENKVLNLVAN